MDTETQGVMIEEELRVELTQTIEQEIHDLQVRLRQVDDQAFELTEEFHAAEDRQEDEKLIERLHRKMMLKIDAGNQIRSKIDTLRHPSELERRVNDKLANHKSLQRLKERRPQMAKETAKDQGVPVDYLNDAGNFRIGMDARYKSDLVSSALELEDEARLTTFKPADARKRLEQRGWMHFLSRKEEILKEKAAKAETRQKEKEVKERERAEAKAAKDQEKAAAKAEKEAAAAEKKAAAANSEGKASTTGKGTTSKAEQMRQQREAAAAK